MIYMICMMIKATVGGYPPSFHNRVFTINIAQVTLYHTDKNTLGDFFVVAQLTIHFRINIGNVK